MANIRSRSLTSVTPGNGSDGRSRAVVDQVAAQMRGASDAVARQAEQVATERRDRIASIQDDSLRRSVGGR